MYPYLMDTDHVTFIARAGPEGTRILAHVAALSPDSVAVPLISYEEQVRGWMAEIARMQSVDRQLDAYSRLDRLREYYCLTPVAPFDEAAVTEFQTYGCCVCVSARWISRLRRQRLRTTQRF